MENCLRSPVTGLVLAWPGKLASRDVRRLQLASEVGGNVCVLFRSRRFAEQNSPAALRLELVPGEHQELKDRKSTRLNSSHVRSSYAVFCLKKKTHSTRLP